MAADSDQICAESVNDLAGVAAREFFRQFAASPNVVVAAPGRVNLMGEHIDYNDGFCLPMAIERYVVIAAALATDKERAAANLFSTAFAGSITISLDSQPQSPSKGWGRLVNGVVAGFMQRGLKIPSFNAVIHSNIPLGAGLASSAALEVATATVLEELTGVSLEPRDKALLCQQAEHRFGAVPCGILDQFSSVFGRTDELMLLDCRSAQIQRIPFGVRDVSVLITNSNVKHDLADGEYALRRRQCAIENLASSSWRDVTAEALERDCGKLSAIEYRRGCHIVSEISRTTDMAEAIQRNEWPRVGELMYASHESLRGDFEVSCKELDILVELAKDIGPHGGVIGSRMTGGGFGGCTVSLVATLRADEIMHKLTSRFRSRTGIEVTAFLSRPARGAYVLRG